MAYETMAYIVMAYIVMAYIVMAYETMAYIVMACIILACVRNSYSSCLHCYGSYRFCHDCAMIRPATVASMHAYTRTCAYSICMCIRMCVHSSLHTCQSAHVCHPVSTDT